MRIAGFLIAAVLPLWAQDIKPPASFERLADKAERATDVTMSKGMLQMASRFLSDRDSDEARTKKVLAGLDGIYVRSFEFSSPGAYSTADLAGVRAQLQAPAWSRIAGVRSRNGDN